MLHNFRVYVDWDQDGFLNLTAKAGDGLNLIPYPTDPTRLGVRGSGGQETNVQQAEVATPFPYGNIIYRVTVPAVVNGYAGVRWGESPPTFIPDQIPVKPNTTYTFQLWAYDEDNDTDNDGKSVIIRIADQDTEYLAAQSGVIEKLSGWKRFSCTFRTIGGTTHIRPSFHAYAPEWARMKMVITGLMLVEGATPAEGYNYGKASNFLDDITPYVTEAVDWRYGYNDLDADMPPPSRLSVRLNNVGGEWFLERANSPFNGLFKRELLTAVIADYFGTLIPQWIGSLKQIAIDASDNGFRTATLTAEDSMLRLLDAEYKPPLQFGLDTGTAIRQLFDNGVLPLPYTRSFLLLDRTTLDNSRLYKNKITSFDVGVTVLPYVGDVLDEGRGISGREYIRQMLRAEMGGRFAWEAKDGRFIFHNRDRDLLNTAPAVTVMRILGNPPPDYTYGDRIVNKATVTFTTRLAGGSAVILYKLDRAQSVRGDAERTFTARFTDLSGAKRSVAGINMIAPIPGQHYTANTAQDGSGADVTSQVSITVTWAASSADITLRSNAGNVYLTKLELWGIPLYASEQQAATYQDGESIAAHGLQELFYDAPVLASMEQADDFARIMVGRKRNPKGIIRSISIPMDASNPQVFDILYYWRIGYKIRVILPYLSNSQEVYVIIGFANVWNVAQNTHMLVAYLQPYAEGDYWRLGLARLGDNTILRL